MNKFWIMKVLMVGTAFAISMTVGVATAQSAIAGGPSIEVGSPAAGSITSDPAEHHIVYSDPQIGAYGDFAMDVGAPAGTQVRPRVSSGASLSLTVDQVFSACTSGGGGDAVRVGVVADGARVGSVVFAHLAAVQVSVGQSVSSETVLGSVAGDLPYDETCWTGPHIHMELTNQTDFACYFPRGVGTPVADGESLGRLGGAYAGQRAVCS